MQTLSNPTPTPILILADAMRPGGMERQILELLAGLRAGGRWRVYFASLDPGGAWEAQASQPAELFLPLRRRWRYDPGVPGRLIRLIREHDLRLLHPWGWMSGLAALHAARRCRIAVVNGALRNAPPRLSVRERISRGTARRSDLFVANSRAGLRAYGLLDHPRARVVYNGMDLRRFEGFQAETFDSPVVCMVGNFTFNKDQALLLRAFARVRREQPRAALMLVGQEGAGRSRRPTDPGPLARCRQLARELNLEAAVRFVTGTTRPEPIIAGSRVCVLASPRNEGTSNAILEYMALGKPVVATDCEGNRELMEDGVTGFLVPAGDIEALAEKIGLLLQDEARARALGEAGRRRVQRLYTAERMTAEYEEVYRSVLHPSLLSPADAPGA